jgi:hypothetical protein
MAMHQKCSNLPLNLKHLKHLVGIISLIFMLTGCDLLSGILSSAYLSDIPLSNKTTPVTNDFVGAWLYKSEIADFPDSPIIVSKKDNFTYNIRFIDIQSDLKEPEKKDTELQAHLTIINGVKFLNVTGGGKYFFLRLVAVTPTKLKMSVLNNEIGDYVQEDRFKSWLANNLNEVYLKDGRGYYERNNKSERIQIFSMSELSKISIQEANNFEKDYLFEQALQLVKPELIQEHLGYLTKKYPKDSRLSILNERLAADRKNSEIAQYKSDFENTDNISGCENFIAKYPKDEKIGEVQGRLNELKLHNKALSEFTVSAFQEYINQYPDKNISKTFRGLITLLDNSQPKEPIEIKIDPNDFKLQEKIGEFLLKNTKIPSEFCNSQMSSGRIPSVSNPIFCISYNRYNPKNEYGFEKFIVEKQNGKLSQITINKSSINYDEGGNISTIYMRHINYRSENNDAQTLVFNNNNYVGRVQFDLLSKGFDFITLEDKNGRSERSRGFKELYSKFDHTLVNTFLLYTCNDVEFVELESSYDVMSRAKYIDELLKFLILNDKTQFAKEIIDFACQKYSINNYYPAVYRDSGSNKLVAPNNRLERCPNFYFDSYLSLILWKENKIDDALSGFKNKAGKTETLTARTGSNSIPYTVNYKDYIIANYKSFKDLGVEFPNEKEVYKQIKKLN